MSCKYSKPFTPKNVISTILFVLTCLVFNNIANAEEKMKITGHYYVAKDKSFDKYEDKIQWEVTSIPEWSKFLVNLRTMPKDDEKNNPMGLKQPDVIHFNVINYDGLSGHDIFISKAGIQKFSRMPVDKYYNAYPEFKEFLETELSINSSYDTAKSNADITQPGIVVIYRGSQQLTNPFWVIKPSEKTVLDRYRTYLNALIPSIVANNSSVLRNDDVLDEDGSFILYLNYPGAPQKILVVGTDASLRGTIIQNQYYFYKDEMGYYSMFKRQAEDNLRAARYIADSPEDKRKKEAARGTLF